MAIAKRQGYEVHVDPKSLPTLQEARSLWDSFRRQDIKDLGGNYDTWENSTSIQGIRSKRFRVWFYGSEPLLIQERLKSIWQGFASVASKKFPAAVKVYVYRQHVQEPYEVWSEKFGCMITRVRPTPKISWFSYNVTVYYRSGK